MIESPDADSLWRIGLDGNRECINYKDPKHDWMFGGRGVRLIALLALIWFLSGGLLGAALRALYGGSWILPCATLNLVLGMLLLGWITRHEREQDILFEGAEREDTDSSLAALLLGIPVILVFVAVVWWVLALFLE